jgi:hypothetical protein
VALLQASTSTHCSDDGRSRSRERGGAEQK